MRAREDLPRRQIPFKKKKKAASYRVCRAHKLQMQGQLFFFEDHATTITDISPPLISDYRDSTFNSPDSLYLTLSLTFLPRLLLKASVLYPLRVFLIPVHKLLFPQILFLEISAFSATRVIFFLRCKICL